MPPAKAHRIWLSACAGLALLAFICIRWHAPRIEAELEVAARDTLVAAGFRALEVVVDGRDAEIRGLVSSPDRAARAVAALSALPGLRRIRPQVSVETDLIEERLVPSPSPSPTPSAALPRSGDFAGLGFQAIRQGAGLTLEGRLEAPDRQLVVATAEAAFRRPVTDRIEEAKSTSLTPRLSRQDIERLFDGLALGPGEAEARVEDFEEPTKPRLVARGLVPGDSIRRSVMLRYSALLEGWRLVDEIQVLQARNAEEVQQRLDADLAVRNIEFLSGSAGISARGQDVLESVAVLLKAVPELQVEVAGHTDLVGDRAVNQLLSERRAEAVVRYLVRRGVGADRLIARGYGDIEPIAGNDTEEGRRRNRRIELKVLQEGTP